MTKSDSIANLATALCAFQSEVANILKTSDNPYFKSKYAKLEDILNEYRPIWTRHGLSISQHPVTDETGRIGVQTEVYHTSGEYRIFPPFYLTLTKNDPQGGGSAITYARRYSLAGVLGIQQEDDDGETHRTEGRDSKADKLKPARDKAYAELKKYAPTDQDILALDKATDQPSLDGIVLSAKTRFERKEAEKTETAEQLHKAIETAWDKLGMTFVHKNNSVKKHLDIDDYSKLTEIDDVPLLKGYREHLREEYKKKGAK